MPTDPFGCRCLTPCSERATQEDMLCDICRRGAGLHLHYGPPSDDPATYDWSTMAPLRPLATMGPPVITEWY